MTTGAHVLAYDARITILDGGSSDKLMFSLRELIQGDDLVSSKLRTMLRAFCEAGICITVQQVNDDPEVHKSQSKVAFS